jgi:signal transduction histidine kinase
MRAYTRRPSASGDLTRAQEVSVATAAQSRRTGVVIGLVIVAVLILNLALWLFYRDLQRDLEADLGRNLENLAVVVAGSLAGQTVLQAAAAIDLAAATGDSLAALFDADVQRIFLDLRRTQEQTQVANITLYDASAKPLLDTIHRQPTSLSRAPILSAGLRLALETRVPAYSALYDNQWMSGFAPLEALGESFAIGVEADAPFFGVLRRVQRSLLLVGALSVVLLLALGAFFLSFQGRVAQAEAAAQRANTLAAVGRMSAGIAHDIRNPLNIIRATASRLQKRYDDPTHPDEKFTFIPEEVDRLNTTLTSYLHFAKDEPPQLQLQDLCVVVHKSLRLLQVELEESHIELQFDAPEMVQARIDEHYLRQAILNVVINAQEAMPDGGRLQVSIAPQAQELRIRFADSGTGIPAEERTRVLEPFYTTKEQGSGLGLAMVNRIVEQHGGRIELSATPHGGAVVDIVLPGP